MMNLFVLSLLLTSFAAACLWSPNPEAKASNRDDNNNVVVKDGHRVVVIEYDKDGHQNTKVLISPDHDESHVIRKPESVRVAEHKLASKAFDVVAHAKDKFKEVATVLPNLGQGISKDTSSDGDADVDGERHGGKEVICDTFDKCKNKIVDAIGIEQVHGRDAYNNGKEGAGKIVNNVKESIVKGGEDVVANITSTAALAKELFQNMAMKFVSKETLNCSMNVVNLFGFSTAYGACIWVTFVSSYVMAGAMPAQQFGMLQSKIYPVYFRAMAFCIGMALFGHALSPGKRLLSSKADMFQGFNLLVSLLATLVNTVYLEPLATKAMYERMKIEKEEGRGIAGGSDGMEGEAAPSSISSSSVRIAHLRTQIMKLKQRLQKLNTYSSIVNILTLMSLTWHLVYLGQCFHMLI